MLISSDVKPILVFDGAKLPMKLDTEEERQRNRLLNKERAFEY